MSAPAAAGEEPAPTPLCTAIMGQFRTLLSAGAGGCLVVQGRTRHGVGETRVLVSLSEWAQWIPAPVLQLLEEDAWHLRVALPVHDDNGSAPIRLGALAATFPVPTVYRNPEDPESTSGRQWVVDAPALEAAVQRAHQAPWGPPTMVIEAATSIVALWGLGEPIAVREAVARARTHLLLRTIAATLGAAVPEASAPLEDLAVPVPGSVIRDPPYAGAVAAVVFEPSRVYDVADVEAALGTRKG